MSIVNPEYSLLKNVSDEDMAKAKHIYGPDIPIIAVWRPHPNAKKFRFICCSGRSGFHPVMLCPCFCDALICTGCSMFSGAIHLQAAHDNTLYIVTEGRFLNNVDLDYPNPSFGCCSDKIIGPDNNKLPSLFADNNKLPSLIGQGFYLDIDEVGVGNTKRGLGSEGCCKCLTNPDDIPLIHFWTRNKEYSFSANSIEDRDEIIRTINRIKTRRDNAKMGGGGGGGVVVAKISKRVFVASASDPTNFSLFLIESDDWASFVLKMKEKFALATISSVKLAEVDIPVTSIAEINVNDKIIIN